MFEVLGDIETEPVFKCVAILAAVSNGYLLSSPKINKIPKKHYCFSAVHVPEPLPKQLETPG